MTLLKHALQQYTNALVECDISSHDTDINIRTKYAKTKKLNFFTGITQDCNSFSAKCQSKACTTTIHQCIGGV